MMKVKGTQTEVTNIKIDVGDDEVERIIRNYESSPMFSLNRLRDSLKREMGMKPEPNIFIHDGEWVEDVEYHTSHEWWSKEKIREATPSENEIFEALDDFEKLLSIAKLKGR